MKIYKPSRKRLQKKVRDLCNTLEEENDVLQMFEPTKDKNNSLAFRIFWVFLVVVCILIYCFQIYDRISYYLQSPIAVDVYEEKLDEFQFPDSHVCVPINKYIKDYYKSSDIIPIDVNSLTPIDTLITRPDVDLTKLWNLNYSFKSIHNLFTIDVRRQQHKMHVPLNIRMKEILTPWGTCTQFVVGGTVKGSEIFTRIGYDITPHELIPGTSFTLISMSLPLDFQMGFVQPGSTYAKLGLRFRSHQFLNTKKEACVQRSEYLECGRKCVESILDDNHCWLPYRPRYSKGRLLPLCNNSEQTLNMYKKNKNDMVAPNPPVACACTRDCETMEADIVMVLEHNTDGTSLGSWHLLDDNVMITKQRFIYELDNLIIDCGGNLGFWLGLSMLSFVNLILFLGKQCAMKLINHKDRTTRQIEAYIRANQPTPKLQQTNRLFSILYLCLFGFSGFILQQKVQMYLNKPIQTTVVVEDPHKVTFPNIITCGGQHNGRVIKAKETYLKQQKLNNSKCNVDILDLLNFNLRGKLLTANKLWDMAYLEPISPDTIKSFHPFPAALFDVRKFSKLPNPLGTCIKHSFGPIPYQLYTMFVDIMPEVEHMCKPDYSQVYISPIEDPDFTLDFNTACFSTLNTVIGIRQLNNHRLNTRRNPCKANLTEYYTCKRQCIDNEIKNKQLCSMPFAIKEDTAFCNSSASAKAVRALYYETHAKIDVEKQCLCLSACKQPFYKINAFNFAAFSAGSSTTLVSLLTNKIETITEEFKYSFIALVSDIGNIFSLTVGLSVLTAMRDSFLLVKTHITINRN